MLPMLSPPVWLIAPGLVATYLLGVVVDRLADELFKWRLLAGRHAANDDTEYRRMRDEAVNSSDFFLSAYSYGKSRQRICRAWTPLAGG